MGTESAAAVAVEKAERDELSQEEMVFVGLLLFLARFSSSSQRTEKRTPRETKFETQRKKDKIEAQKKPPLEAKRKSRRAENKRNSCFKSQHARNTVV